MDGLHALEATSRREAVELLRTAALVRVVFTHRAIPAAIPVAFAVDGDGIVIRTGQDTRLRGAIGSVVAIEADHFDRATGEGWSVILQGIAEEITDPVHRARANGQVPRLVPGDLDVFVRVPMTNISGRRIVTAEVMTGSLAPA
jgi:uncharacterized protein